MPAAFTLSWTAGVLELVLGGLMLIGLFTRPAAFIASGEMAAAYFIAHAPRNLFPVLNGGDAAILYCFVFLHRRGRRGTMEPGCAARTDVTVRRRPALHARLARGSATSR